MIPLFSLTPTLETSGYKVFLDLPFYSLESILWKVFPAFSPLQVLLPVGLLWAFSTPPLEYLLLVTCFHDPSSLPCPNHSQTHHPRAGLLHLGPMDTVGCVLLCCRRVFCVLLDVRQHSWPLPSTHSSHDPKMSPGGEKSPSLRTMALKHDSNTLLLLETLSGSPMSSQQVFRKETVFKRLGNYVSYLRSLFSGDFGLHHLWAGVQGVVGKRGKEAKQRGQLTDSPLVWQLRLHGWGYPCLETVRQGGLDTQGSGPDGADWTPGPSLLNSRTLGLSFRLSLLWFACLKTGMKTVPNS